MKKTFAIVALVAVVGVLVVGAIYRTQARAGTGDGIHARSEDGHRGDAAANRQVDGYFGGRHDGRERGRGADRETHGGAAYDALVNADIGWAGHGMRWGQ